MAGRRQKASEGLRGPGKGPWAWGGPPSRLCVLEGGTVRDSLKWNRGIDDKSARITVPIEHLCVTGNTQVHLYLRPATQGCGRRQQVARGPHRHPTDDRSDLRAASRIAGAPAHTGPQARSLAANLCLPLPPPRGASSLSTTSLRVLASPGAALSPAPSSPPGRMSPGLPSELPKRVISVLLCNKFPQMQLKTANL